MFWHRYTERQSKRTVATCKPGAQLETVIVLQKLIPYWLIQFLSDFLFHVMFFHHYTERYSKRTVATCKPDAQRETVLVGVYCKIRTVVSTKLVNSDPMHDLLTVTTGIGKSHNNQGSTWLLCQRATSHVFREATPNGPPLYGAYSTNHYIRHFHTTNYNLKLEQRVYLHTEYKSAQHDNSV